MFTEKIYSLLRVGITTFIILSTFGCAVSGPVFEEVSSIPPDKSLIYIYRSATMRGAAHTPYVVVNKSNAMPLRPGGYYPYFSDPGEAEIVIKNVGQSKIKVNLVAGESYYVKGGTVPMAMGVPSIKLMPADTGLIEVKQCKRQQDVNNQNVGGNE